MEEFATILPPVSSTMLNTTSLAPSSLSAKAKQQRHWLHEEVHELLSHESQRSTRKAATSMAALTIFTLCTCIVGRIVTEDAVVVKMVKWGK